VILWTLFIALSKGRPLGTGRLEALHIYTDDTSTDSL